MHVIEDFRQIPAVEVFSPPEQTIPFIFNSPHSGNYYPKSFLDASQLDAQNIRQSEDLYVDYLFSDVLKSGATLIRANFPRAYLDVNREPYELDPNMFKNQLPSYINSGSPKVAGGIGTIARIVGKSKEIYNHQLDIDEVLHRIEILYKPYHLTLQKTIERIHNKFGYVVLIDCHSMPTRYWENKNIFRPDLILGDRFGSSCPNNLTDSTEKIFHSLDYSVGRNKPFAGGYITEKYGQPELGYFTIQIELSRKLYMNESEFNLTANAEKVKDDLTEFAKQISQKFIPNINMAQIAAE